MPGDWKEIDPSTLRPHLQEAYTGMKAQYRVYAADKAKFEQAMQEAFGANMPEGQELKFGYNFGKLSVAVGPARERKPKKEPKDSQGLADWLSAQAQGGHRA